jgi:molybdate transport system ATP-binding protein
LGRAEAQIAGEVRGEAAETARLRVKVRHGIGTLAIDVDFALTQPWSILFGPSGSGKTTVLRAIAGVLRPGMSRVERAGVGGAQSEVFEAGEGANGRLEPQLRGMPLATQAANLFPHMTVDENVMYGMRAGERARRLEKLDDALGLFRIGHIVHKLPAALSGGEAQRVNLARAAAAAREGGVLLLDEPFTGLDVALRSELMQDLKAWAARRNLCVLSVTHDVAEAFELGAEVVKLKEGRVVAQGPVGVVLAEERRRLMEQLGG